MPVQYNNNLADWAKNVVKGLSLRQVEIKTGVTYSTTKNILDGRVPEATILIRFAGAFGEDIPEVLRLGGYADIADLWDQGQTRTEKNRASEAIQENTVELVYETAEENYPQLQAYYEGMAPEDRDELLQIAEMKWRKRRKAETTHGKLPSTDE